MTYPRTQSCEWQGWALGPGLAHPKCILTVKMNSKPFKPPCQSQADLPWAHPTFLCIKKEPMKPRAIGDAESNVSTHRGSPIPETNLGETTHFDSLCPSPPWSFPQYSTPPPSENAWQLSVLENAPFQRVMLLPEFHQPVFIFPKLISGFKI